MKELAFLKKLKKKKIINLVEPSDEIGFSYLIKSENCLKSAKILFKNNLYENSTSESYYCMYNSVLSLLFKIGVKSENHSASVILFNKLIKNDEMTKTILWAKEERIDKQYYVETRQIELTKDSCNDMLLKAEDFLIKMKIIINGIGDEKISFMRDYFEKEID